MLLHQGRARHIDMARERANAQAKRWVQRDAAQALYLRHRDQVAGCQHALAHAQHQRRAAGNHACIVAILGKQAAGFFHAGRFQKIKFTHEELLGRWTFVPATRPAPSRG